MKLKPRPYQTTGINDIRAAIAGVHADSHRPRIGHSGRSRAVIYVLSTGGGKTAVYAMIADGAASKGNHVLILEHRKELIKQASMALAGLGVAHRIVAPAAKVAWIRRLQIEKYGRPWIDQGAAVAVASVQTLARRLSWLDEFRPALVIADEAHHRVAGTWKRIGDATPYAVEIGVTATPCRTNGQGLRDVYEVMVLGPSMPELIADGYLVPPVIYAPPLSDDDEAELDAVGRKGGDIDPEKMAEIMDRPTITGSAVDHYGKHCPGRPAIIFCCNRKHAHHVAAQFQAAGWRFFVIDGTMDDAERDRLINGLEDGSVQGLVSVDLISEGTDIPLVEAIFMLRRTDSEGMYLQMAGRVLRPVYAPGFDLDTLEGRLAAIQASGKAGGLIFDHVGNWLRHGKPQDHREWTLEGKRRRKRKKQDIEDDIKISQCPNCYHVHEPADTCPECGHIYMPDARRGMRERDGELALVPDTVEEIERREAWRAQGQARTREELIAQGINGKRAAHILAARQEKQRLQDDLKRLYESWQARGGRVMRDWGCTRSDIDKMKPKELRQRIEDVSKALFTGPEAANENTVIGRCNTMQ